MLFTHRYILTILSIYMTLYLDPNHDSNARNLEKMIEVYPNASSPSHSKPKSDIKNTYRAMDIVRIYIES
jgi:hypothetical protein